MMRAISRKLRGQRGASMLLALLFLLICSMVAASILMAAAANAGKQRSNLEEHQTYLALSSAVSTLCDELNRSEYAGQYCSWQELWPTGTDEAGQTTYTPVYFFQQKPGLYLHTSSDQPGYLKDLLLSNFDALFSRQINATLDRTNFQTFDLQPSDSVMEHSLTLTPDPGTDPDRRTVHLTLEVQDSYAIYVTAWLEDLEAYKVKAELTPNDNKPQLPASLPYRGAGVTEKTEPMKWRLGWIIIPDAEEETTP